MFLNQAGKQSRIELEQNIDSVVDELVEEKSKTNNSLFDRIKIYKKNFWNKFFPDKKKLTFVLMLFLISVIVSSTAFFSTFSQDDDLKIVDDDFNGFNTSKANDTNFDNSNFSSNESNNKTVPDPSYLETVLNDINNSLLMNKSVFLLFYSNSCGYCSDQIKVYEDIKENFSERIKFMDFNRDECEEVFDYFDVNSYPSMFFIKEKVDEEFVFRNFKGFHDKEFLVDFFTNFFNESVDEDDWDSGDLNPPKAVGLPLEVSEKISKGETSRVILRFDKSKDVSLNKEVFSGFKDVFSDESGSYISGVLDSNVYNKIKFDENIVSVYPDNDFSVFLDESLPLINYDKSFNKFNLTGNGTKICILDTGVDKSVVNYSYGYDFVNDDSVPDDGNGHGTKVASVIDSIASDAEIVVAKVVSADGSGYESTVLEGLEWCIDQNPDVISFSVGTTKSCNGFCDSNLVASMANKAYDMGIFVVAASGNSGLKNISSPACGSNVFSVGATDDYDNIAGFSNVNPTLDVFAPGVDVTTETGTSSGTSISVPHVVGAVSLLLEKENGISLNDLKYRLRSTGKKIKYNYNESLKIDIGRLDIYNALINKKTMEPYDYSDWWHGIITDENYTSYATCAQACVNNCGTGWTGSCQPAQGGMSSCSPCDPSGCKLCDNCNGCSGFIAWCVCSCNTPPSVSTSSIQDGDIGEISATLRGSVDSVTCGGSGQKGFYWKRHSDASYTACVDLVNPLSTGSYSKNCPASGGSSFVRGELYYYYAYARDQGGSDSDTPTRFLTKPAQLSSFSATADGETEIDLSWSHGTGGDKIYLEYTTSVEIAENWSPGDGTQVPGGSSGVFTGTSTSHTSLDSGTKYYYKAWSIAVDGPLGSEQESDGTNSKPYGTASTDDATTDSSNNAPVIGSFNLVDEGNSGWDLDNDNFTFDCTVSDSDSDSLTYLFSFSKGGTPDDPTTGSYMARITGVTSGNYDKENYDLDWADGEPAEAWVDTDSTVTVKMRVHDVTDYSTTVESDTFSNGIDGSPPTFDSFSLDADTDDDGGNDINPDTGWYDDLTIQGDFSGCSDATSGIDGYYIQTDSDGYGDKSESEDDVGCTAAGEGTNQNINYKITDNAGNEATGDTTDDVSIDTTAPTSTDAMSAYSEGGDTDEMYGVTGSNTFYFSNSFDSAGTATFSCTFTDSNQWKVDYGSFGADNPSADDSSPYQGQYTINDDDSSDTITVISYDSAGNSDSDTITCTEDSVSPGIATGSWSESNDYLYVTGGDLYFSDLMAGTVTATLSGTAEDEGGSGLQNLSFSNEASLASSPGDDNSPASWTGDYGIETASTGTNSPATVTVYDNVGNTGTASYDYIEDTTGPTAPTGAACHDDQGSGNAEWDNDTTIYFTFNEDSTDGGAGILDYYCEICDACGDCDEIDSGTGGLDTDIGTEGAVTYYVRAKDNVGNYGTCDDDTITIDLTNPNTTIMDYPDSGEPDGPDSIWGGSTDSSPGQIDKVEIYIKDTSDNEYWTGSSWGSLTWLSASANDSTFNSDDEDWNYDSSDVTWTGGNSYEIKANATDKAGNDDSASMAVDTFTISQNISITVTPATWDQGSIAIGGSNQTTGFYYNLTNNGNVAIDVFVKATNATNVSANAEWKLNNTASHNNFSLRYYKNGGASWINITTSYNYSSPFVSSLAAGDSQTFDLKIMAATTSSKTDPLDFDITFKSVAS